MDLIKKIFYWIRSFLKKSGDQDMSVDEDINIDDSASGDGTTVIVDHDKDENFYESMRFEPFYDTMDKNELLKLKDDVLTILSEMPGTEMKNKFPSFDERAVGHLIEAVDGVYE